jgi:hypothetical protein
MMLFRREAVQKSLRLAASWKTFGREVARQKDGESRTSEKVLAVEEENRGPAQELLMKEFWFWVAACPGAANSDRI